MISPTLVPGLQEVRLIEQRTYETTVYSIVRRKWVDGDGNVTTEEDAPQVQLQIPEWPEMQAAWQQYIALAEKAAAYRLGYIADPGQTYQAPAVII